MGILIECVPDYIVRHYVKKLKDRLEKEKIEANFNNDNNQTDNDLANPNCRRTTTFGKFQLIRISPEDIHGKITAKLYQNIYDHHIHDDCDKFEHLL